MSNDLTLDVRDVEAYRAKLEKMVPDALKELGEIITMSANENTRLRAIELLFKVLGIDSDTLNPKAARNKVLIQMINMMSPQLIHEAKGSGVQIPAEIEEAVELDDLDKDLRPDMYPPGTDEEIKDVYDVAYRHAE